MKYSTNRPHNTHKEARSEQSSCSVRASVGNHYQTTSWSWACRVDKHLSVEGNCQIKQVNFRFRMRYSRGSRLPVWPRIARLRDCYSLAPANRPFANFLHVPGTRRKGIVPVWQGFARRSCRAFSLRSASMLSLAYCGTSSASGLHNVDRLSLTSCRPALWHVRARISTTHRHSNDRRY